MNDSQKPVLNIHLTQVRKEQLLTQKQLAERIGTTSENVSRWENGVTRPSPYFLQKLSEVFGKTPAELGLLSPPSTLGEARIWNVPIKRNPFFTGREDLLDLLLQRLSSKRVAALTQAQMRAPAQAQALYGLGGIGKTQTATEFAFRNRDYYSHVLWLQANSREELLADIVTLSELLGLPQPYKDEQYQKRVVAAVKIWLAEHDDWLLILDNADDLPMAQQYLPTRHKGYVLFTTRAQAAGIIADSIEVEKLNLEEATLLLLRASKRLDEQAPLNLAKAEDRAAAEQIAREMDGLPLALTQAAAFIDETGCTLANYLRLYVSNRKKLLARRSELMVNYPDTVETAWSISFQRVEAQSPLAASLLRLCAFLAPDAIPEELFTRGIVALNGTPEVEAQDELQLYEALAILGKYSLLRRNSESRMLNIHRLVQAVLKESMDEQTRRLWAERTVRVVNATFPELNYGNAATQQQHYLPHVQECATLIEQYHLHYQETAHLLYRAGKFLSYHAFYPQSQSLHLQALTIRKEILGADHPEVADSLNERAVLARNQGDYQQAEEFHQQALTIRKKALGERHPATTTSLNNLSVLYRIQGKHEQAEPLLREALSINKEILGPEHLDTLAFSINLANLYVEQRKYEQAESLLKETLAISKQTLVPDHLVIAQILNLLAKLYLEQKDYAQAEALWKQTLPIFEKTIGPEHPVLAEILNNLAKLYSAQGCYSEAWSFCQRAFSISEKAFGPEHSDTIAYHEHLTKILNKLKEE